MKILEGKSALITGSSRGIGKAIASTFAQNGANIMLHGRNETKLKETAEELKQYDVQVEWFGADNCDYQAMEKLVVTTADKFGRLDVLVNNAGITQDNLIAKMTNEEWDNVIRTNLNGMFATCRAAYRYMSGQKSGSVINISSVTGITGMSGQANYATTKAGIIGFSKSLAKEFARRKIRVNVIAPGYIETDMVAAMPDEEKKGIVSLIPLKRIGKPEEVANLAKFLASDESSYVTGQVFVIDGGMTI